MFVSEEEKSLDVQVIFFCIPEGFRYGGRKPGQYMTFPCQRSSSFSEWELLYRLPVSQIISKIVSRFTYVKPPGLALLLRQAAAEKGDSGAAHRYAVIKACAGGHFQNVNRNPKPRCSQCNTYRAKSM